MPRYAAIVTMWLASASLAEEPQSSVAISLEQPPASYVALGSLLVELEATTLPDLVETWVWVCYDTTDDVLTMGEAMRSASPTVAVSFASLQTVRWADPSGQSRTSLSRQRTRAR